MGTLGKGYTFGATEEVTAAKLHTLVDSGTVTGIVADDITDNTITAAKIQSVSGAAFTLLGSIPSGAGVIPAANLTSVAQKGANSDITSIPGLTTPLAVTKGGTGLSSATQGDILYASAADTLAKLAAGTSGYYLKTQGAGANPIWSLPLIMKTGTYTGNGSATQAITGIGGQPKFLIIWSRVGPEICFKTDQDGTKTLQCNAAGTWSYVDDVVISLDADGFTIGDGTGGTNYFNVNSETNTYMALIG